MSQAARDELTGGLQSPPTCLTTRIRQRIFVMTSLGERANVKFKRITIDPDQMGGTPCIRGLRIPVATVVGMVADGMSDSEILAAYPDLEPEDIRESLRYAAEAVRERSLPLVS